MMTLPRKTLTACLALAAVGGVAVPALAGVNEYDTKVAISERPLNFHGQVHSDAAFCENHRVVKLFREEFGPDTLIGKDKTNSEGRWVVPTKLGPGGYYAKAPRKERIISGNGILCRSDRSRVLIFD